MKHTLPKIFLLLAFVLLGSSISAQLTGWAYRMPFTVTETMGAPQTNYQVRLVVNTAALVSAGHMQASGDDIRFADSCSTTIIPHFVESGMNTAATVIWVRVPSLPANGSTTVFMYYGNPLASNTSSFTAVFPVTLITGGPNQTLTGTQTFDYIQVDANDTIFVQAGATLTLNARYAFINGAIVGNGGGHQAPAINTAGTGPGAGTTSTNSGSGGGSYGGQGGLGGLDPGDTPGNGGPTYGTQTGTDIDMGSSGGSGTTPGGSGGGAVSINADYLMVTGAIHMDGTAAATTASRGGGGGAGGGVLMNAYDLTFSGTASASGGAGGQGSSTFNDGGGGGGGGRIKGFAGGTLTNTGTASVAAGSGGGFGDQAPGQSGAIGTTHFGAGTWLVPSVVAGAETELIISAVTLSDPDSTICAGDSITITVSSGFDTYEYSVNGSPVASGVSNMHTFTGLNNGDVIGVTAGIPACISDSWSTTVTVNALPSVLVTVSDAVVCAGDTVTLAASGAVTFMWQPGPLFQPTVTVVPGSTTTYTVTGVDANGCMDTAQTAITVNPLPAVSAGGDLSMCAGDSVMLPGNGGGPITICLWDPGIIGGCNPYVSPAMTTTYTLTVTDTTTGCSAMDSMTVTVNQPPFVVATAAPPSGCAPFCTQLISTSSNACAASSWDFGDSSTGTNENETHCYPVAGVYVVTYTCIDTNGCTATSAPVTINVNQPPTVTLSMPNFICIDDAPLALTGGSPAGGTYSGTGVSGNAFNPQTAGTGTHLVTYIYSDSSNCSDTVTAQIIVSACVGMGELLLVNAVSIFPNPNNGSFTLSVMKTLSTDLLVEISDLQGRLVHSENLQQVNAGFVKTIDLDQISSGIYSLKLSSGAERRVEKLVIRK